MCLTNGILLVLEDFQKIPVRHKTAQATSSCWCLIQPLLSAHTSAAAAGQSWNFGHVSEAAAAVLGAAVVGTPQVAQEHWRDGIRMDVIKMDLITAQLC